MMPRGDRAPQSSSNGTSAPFLLLAFVALCWGRAAGDENATDASTATASSTGSPSASLSSTRTRTPSLTGTSTPTNSPDPPLTNTEPIVTFDAAALAGSAFAAKPGSATELVAAQLYLINLDAAPDLLRDIPTAQLNVADPDTLFNGGAGDYISELRVRVVTSGGAQGVCSWTAASGGGGGGGGGGGMVEFSMDVDAERASRLAVPAWTTTPVWNALQCALQVSAPSQGWTPAQARAVLYSLRGALSGQPAAGTLTAITLQLTVRDQPARRDPARRDGQSAPQATSVPATVANAFVYVKTPLVITSPDAAQALQRTGAQRLVATEGAAVAVFSDLTLTATSGNVKGFQVTVAAGCHPGDTLGVPAAAVAALLSSPSHGGGSAGCPAAVANVTGQCPLALTMSGCTRQADAYVSLLRSVTLTAGAGNGVPRTTPRVVTLAVGSATAAPPFDAGTFALVEVVPVNDAVRTGAGWTGAAALAENAEPLLEVTVAQDCSAGSAAVATSRAGGAAGVCLVDPDPVFVAHANASAAAAVAPQQQASDYAVAVTVAANSVFPALLTAAPAAAVGDAVTDCSVPYGGGGAAGSASAPASSGGVVLASPCWRRRYRLASSPLDFEAPGATPAARALSVTLAVSDWFALDPDPSRSPRTLAATAVTVTLTDADDAPVVGWHPAAVNASRYRRVVLDDATGVPLPGFAAALALYDQDVGDHGGGGAGGGNVVTLQQVAADGSTTTAATGFVLTRVSGSPVATTSPAPSSSPATVGATYVSTYDLRGSGPLAATAAKTYELRVVVRPAGAAATGAPNVTFPLTVDVVRPNAPVALVRPALPSSGVLDVAVAEHAPVGTTVAALSAGDDDAHQALAFTLLSSTARPALAGAFALQPREFTLATCVDAATGGSRVVNVSRGAALVVARDALDYETGDAVTDLLVRVEDDATQCTSSLPPQPRTTQTFTLRVSLTNDVGDTPRLVEVRGVPPDGLPSAGGVLVELRGDYLGLPDGPASGVSARFIDPRTGLTGAFTDCAVVERLRRVRCLSPPGYGANVTVGVTVPGQPDVVLLGAFGFQRPLARNVTPGLLPTSGQRDAYFFVDSPTFPWRADANASYAVTLAGGGRSRIPVGGCTVHNGTAAGGGAAVRCPLPEGAGAGLAVDVTVDGVSAFPPALSYAPPAVTAVTVVAQADRVLLRVVGTNLGTASTLDWVRYAAQAPYYSCASPLAAGCDAAAAAATAGGCDAAASCLLHQAAGCTFVVNHTQLQCTADPAGWGTGFRLQLAVGGQVSGWLDAPPFDYPPPAIANVTVVVAGNALQPVIPFMESVRLYHKRSTDFLPERYAAAATHGGSVIRIAGTGLSLNYQRELNLTIGGVPVAIDDVARNGTVYVVTATAPEGFGNVTVSLAVGRRTASSSLQYQALELLSAVKGSKDGDITYFRAVGVGLSRCAYLLCLATDATNVDGNMRRCRRDLAPCALPDAFAGSRSVGGGRGHPLCYSIDLGGARPMDAFVPQCNRCNDGSSGCPLPERYLQRLKDTNQTCGDDAFPLYDDSLCIGATTRKATLTVSLAGASDAYSYDSNALADDVPEITSITLPLAGDRVRWYAGDTVAVLGKNAGTSGELVITDARGLVNFTCPMVYSTRVYEDATSPEKLYSDGKPPPPDAIVTQPGYGVRTIYDGSSWTLLTYPPPCYLLSWAHTASSQRAISVVAPVWQGRVTVIVRAEIDSAPSSEQTYERPAIESVSPPELPPHGGVITIRGSHFGAQQDPVDGLLALQAQQAANDAYMRVNAGARGVYASAAFVMYAGDEPRDVADKPERWCHVQRAADWSDTAITCRAPRGVPGAAYVVYVLQADAKDAELFRSARTLKASGRYQLANVTAVVAPSGVKPAAGGYNVTLSGRLFALNCTAGAACGASPSVAGSLSATPSASASAAANGNTTVASSGSASASASATGSASRTPTPSSTASLSVGASRSASPSTSGTSTSTASLRGTESPSGKSSPSATASTTASRTVSPSSTPSATRSGSGSSSATASASTTPSSSSTGSVSGSAPATQSGSPSATLSAGASPSATPPQSSTSTPAPTPTTPPTPAPPPAEPLSYGWDGEWEARVLLLAEPGLGRLKGGARDMVLDREQPVFRVTRTSDGDLTFLMPPALGTVNISVQYLRRTAAGVSDDTPESPPVQLTVDAPAITAVETINPADDPCQLLTYHAAVKPCGEITAARGPFRTQNLTYALRACYVNATVPIAYVVPPVPGVVVRLDDSAAANDTTNATATPPGAVAFSVGDAYSPGAVACLVTLFAANRTCVARGADYCGAGTPLACAVLNTTAAGSPLVNVSVTTTPGGGEAVCSALVSLPPPQAPTANVTNASISNATVGGWAVVTSPAGASLRKPCGAVPAWPLVGRCHGDAVVGRTNAFVLESCFNVSAAAQAAGARADTAMVAVAAGSPESVAACDLVATVLDGKTGAYAGWNVDPTDDAALMRIRANTFCWPRFPLSPASDAQYTRCIKANTNLRRLRISGRNFGDADVVDASIGGVACARAEVVSDTAVTCELETAASAPLPVGDLAAVVVAKNDRSASSGVYYRVSSMLAAGGGGGAAPVTVRSVCRLGTRYDNATGACAACPDGYNGECLGGDGALPFFAPRAVAKFWRTDPAEWLAQRSINVTPVAPGDFVRCAVPDLCLPNQLCRTGSSGWMCVDCAPGWARGIDGTCANCDVDLAATESLIITTVVVVLALACAYGAYLKVPAVRAGADAARGALEGCLRRLDGRSDAPDDAAASGDADVAKPAPPGGAERPARSAGAQRGAGGSSDAEPQPGKMIYLKVILGYAQTLSAINALLASAKVASKDTGEVQPGDAQLVPNVLVAASILGELGLSTRQVACVFKKWSGGIDDQITVIKATVLMYLPLAVLCAAPLVLLAEAAAKYVGRRVSAVRQRGHPGNPVSATSSVSAESTAASRAAAAAAEDEDPASTPVVFIESPMRAAAARSSSSNTPGGLAPSPRSPSGGGASTDSAAGKQETEQPPPRGLSYWLVFVLYATLSPAIGAMARLQSCAADKDGGFLADDPTVSCAEPAFQRLQRTAAAFGFLYLFVPLVLGVFLALPWPRPFVKALPFTFLLEAYRETRWVEPRLDVHLFLERLRAGWMHVPYGWEAWALFRKGMLMAVASGLVGTRSAGTKITATLMILLLALLAQAFTAPWGFPIINHLETLAILGEVGFAISTLGRVFDGSAATSGADKTFFDAMGVAINVPLVLLALLHLADRAANRGRATRAFVVWWAQEQHSARSLAVALTSTPEQRAAAMRATYGLHVSAAGGGSGTGGRHAKLRGVIASPGGGGGGGGDGSGGSAGADSGGRQATNPLFFAGRPSAGRQPTIAAVGGNADRVRTALSAFIPRPTQEAVQQHQQLQRPRERPVVVRMASLSSLVSDRGGGSGRSIGSGAGGGDGGSGGDAAHPGGAASRHHHHAGANRAALQQLQARGGSDNSIGGGSSPDSTGSSRVVVPVSAVTAGSLGYAFPASAESAAAASARSKLKSYRSVRGAPFAPVVVRPAADGKRGDGGSGSSGSPTRVRRPGQVRSASAAAAAAAGDGRAPADV